MAASKFHQMCEWVRKPSDCDSQLLNHPSFTLWGQESQSGKHLAYTARSEFPFSWIYKCNKRKVDWYHSAGITSEVASVWLEDGHIPVVEGNLIQKRFHLLWDRAAYLSQGGLRRERQWRYALWGYSVKPCSNDILLVSGECEYLYLAVGDSTML